MKKGNELRRLKKYLWAKKQQKKIYFLISKKVKQAKARKVYCKENIGFKRNATKEILSSFFLAWYLNWQKTKRRALPFSHLKVSKEKCLNIRQDFRKLAMMVGLGFCLSTGSVLAMPQDGQVIEGQGNITKNGNQMDIQQQTNRMAIDWTSFNIAQNEIVRFNQPGANAVALNRVLGNDPSAIYGSLQANGQIYLVNPNGILFGQGSRVDVGALVASTLNMNVADFMAGNDLFQRALNSVGKIENAGEIKVATGGTAALIGSHITNNGIIIANEGKVLLASGEKVTFGDHLIGLAIEKSTVDTIIKNNGVIKADGGIVLLNAQGLSEVVADVINIGNISANKLIEKNGIISLIASGEIINKGELKAQEGFVNTEAGKLNYQAGKIDVTGDNAGTIKVLGQDVILKDAVLNASGINSGGEVLIGGNYQGQGIEKNAQSLIVENSTVYANAIAKGNGGKVILWSDKKTGFEGQIEAKGGLLSGNGGFVEVSGKEKLYFNGLVNASAKMGKSGKLLLDPNNFTIAAAGGDMTGAALSAQLNASSTEVEIKTSSMGTPGGDGDIFVNDDVTWDSEAGLVLNAERNITVNNTIVNTGDNADITILATNDITVNTDIKTSGDFADILLRADSDADGVGIVSFGGSGMLTAKNALTGGSIKIQYNPPGGYGAVEKTVFDANMTAYSGNKNTYFLVNGLADLQSLATTPAYWNKNFALGQDIDLSAHAGNWTPIGGDSDTDTRPTGFSGLFDGNDNIISNLYYNNSNKYYVGLFGMVKGKVENLGLKDVNITAKSVLGGLTGELYGAGAMAEPTIDNCYTTGSLTGNSALGGLVGSIYVEAGANASVTNSFSTNDINFSSDEAGNASCGGLLGIAAVENDSTIKVENSFSTGSIINTSEFGSCYLGGLAGRLVLGSGAIGNIIVKNSYSWSDVSTNQNDYVGGLVGYLENENELGSSYNLIQNSYSIGEVSGLDSTRVGGLVGGEIGVNNSAENSFWDTEKSSTETSAVGIGHTTSWMQVKNNFENAGWDFNDTWRMTENNKYYPAFDWQPYTIVGLWDGALSGKIVKAIVNGSNVNIDAVATDSLGRYTLLVPQDTEAGNLLLYLSDNDHYAATGYYFNKNSSLVNLYNNKLTADSSFGETQDFALAKGAYVDNKIPYTYNADTLTLTNNVGFKAEGGFKLDRSISTTNASQEFQGAVTAEQEVNLTANTTGDISFLDTFSSTNGAVNINALGGKVTFSDLVTVEGDTNINADEIEINATMDLNANNLTLIATDSLTLNNDALIKTTSASATALKLVVGTTFQNNSDNVNPFLANNGKWQLYSVKPQDNTNEPSDFDFKEYNKSYGDALSDAGNALVYSYAPNITFGLKGEVSKTYDGTELYTGTFENFLANNLEGFSDSSGDVVYIYFADPGRAVRYLSKNAGTNIPVEFGGEEAWTVSNVTNNEKPVYGYVFTNEGAALTANIGRINKANLTYTAIAVTKEQGEVNPNLTGGVTGFVSGETQANATTGSLVWLTNATTGSSEGSYYINGSGLEAVNYNFVQAAGNATALTIVTSPAPKPDPPKPDPPKPDPPKPDPPKPDPPKPEPPKPEPPKPEPNPDDILDPIPNEKAKEIIAPVQKAGTEVTLQMSQGTEKAITITNKIDNVKNDSLVQIEGSIVKKDTFADSNAGAVVKVVDAKNTVDSETKITEMKGFTNAKLNTNDSIEKNVTQNSALSIQSKKDSLVITGLNLLKPAEFNNRTIPVFVNSKNTGSSLNGNYIVKVDKNMLVLAPTNDLASNNSVVSNFADTDIVAKNVQESNFLLSDYVAESSEQAVNLPMAGFKVVVQNNILEIIPLNEAAIEIVARGGNEKILAAMGVATANQDLGVANISTVVIQNIK